MAKSLNRVTLIGNLGADPELRATPSGASVCTFSIATTENYKDRNGEWQSVTDWHKISLWERLAETADKYLKKGSKIYVEGKLKTRTYEQDGITKYFTDVRASSFIMLDSRDSSGSDGSYSAQGESFGKTAEGALPSDDEDEVPF